MVALEQRALLGFGRAVQWALTKPPLSRREELVPGVDHVGAFLDAVVDARWRALDVVELLAHVGNEAVERHKILVLVSRRAAACLWRGHGDPWQCAGHALEFVLSELPTARFVSSSSSLARMLRPRSSSATAWHLATISSIWSCPCRWGR